MIKQIMSQQSHWQINKDFARTFGLDATILMTDLIDKWLYQDRPEWFWGTSEQIEEATTLSRHKQNKAFAVLEREGFVERKLMGIPAKQHYRVVESKVVNFFQTGLREIRKLDCENFESSIRSNNTESKNTNNNNTVENPESRNSLKTERPNTKDQNDEFSTLPSDVLELPQEVLEAFGDALMPTTKTAAKQWLDTWSKLQRIDGLTEGELIAIVVETRKDHFWGKNFLALPKMRRKNPEGVPYWKVFRAAMKTNEPQTKNPYNGKSASEIEGAIRRAANWEL